MTAQIVANEHPFTLIYLRIIVIEISISICEGTKLSKWHSFLAQ